MALLRSSAYQQKSVIIDMFCNVTGSGESRSNFTAAHPLLSSSEAAGKRELNFS